MMGRMITTATSRALALAARALAALACAPAATPAAQPASTASPTPGSTVRQVAVTPESAVIAVGATKALTARVTYVDGSQDARVTWSSMDDTVVEVDPDSGLATGVAPGVTAVRATSVVDLQRQAVVSFTVRDPR